MKAQSLVAKGSHAETRTFDFSSPSTEELTESAIFFSREGVAFDQAGAALPFSFLSMPQQHLEAELKTSVQQIFESRRESSRSLNESVYIPALIPGYWNYYHLLIDCLPRVLLSREMDAASPRILVTRFQAARLQRAQGNLLSQIGSIFGLDGCMEVVEGDLLHLAKATIPKQKIRFIGSTMRFFQDVAARSCKERAHRRIYVSRKLTTARRVINEEAVVAILKEFGFQPVYPEQMPLGEQIKLFRESNVIVGPHGAGLANIVFSCPGTTLFEFLQERGLYKIPIFSELSAMAGGKHVVLPCKSETNPNHPGHPGNMDMSVDCSELRAVLKSLLS